MNLKILTINPGSTSTKVTLFENDKEAFSIKLHHEATDLAKFPRVVDQREYRAKLIRDGLAKHQLDLKTLNAIVGRGGLIRPIPSGTYEVNTKMLQDLKEGRTDHASNLGAVLADELLKECAPTCKAYIVDPVVVDEFIPLARYSGTKHIERLSIFHALNQKAVARKTAQKIGKAYEECNFVVCHMGGGISVGAHLKGKIIDNNNALDGEGPFSPERSGGLPVGQLIELCFSGRFTHSEVKKMIKGQGGMVSYCNTNDALDVEKKAEAGDPHCTEVQDAMIYQIAKEIGAYATTLHGKVDRIILTGGMAYGKYLINEISKRVSFIAPIEVIAGENEMEALYLGAKRVLQGQEVPKIY